GAVLEQQLQLAADLGGLGGEAQVLGGGRLGHEHDVLRLVAGAAEGPGQALDVGLGVGQVAELVGVVLADAHEQGDLVAAGPAGRRGGGGGGGGAQQHLCRYRRTNWLETHHGVPRGRHYTFAPVRAQTSQKRYGSTRTNLTAVPWETDKNRTGL